MTIDPTTIATTPTPARDRHRSMSAAVLALLVLAATLTVVRAGSSIDPSDGSSAGGSEAGEPGADPGGDGVGTDETLEVDDVVATSGQPGPLGDGVELSGGDPVPADPCDALTPGQSLLVTPDPLHLEPEVMASELRVTNCSDAPVDWTAQTVPQVTLQLDAGTLAGGAEVDISFSIDPGAIGAGAFDFGIKVSEPGANTYVDVHAFKGIVNADIVPENPALQAAPGSGGCALQCITKAWLTPNASNADLSLEVQTTVPAALRVWVSTDVPTVNGGVPSFPGVGPIASTAAQVTSWTTPLTPLEATTSYHIVVEATDAHDNVGYQVGEFTTISPAAGPAALAPNDDVGGCASQCITKAMLAPVEGGADASIEVETTVPTVIEVFVSEQPPSIDADGVPSFPGVDPVATTGGETEASWTATLTGLKGGTEHHIVVSAVDGEGRRAHRAGSFHNPEVEHTLLVTFHRIDVTYDGDGKYNRGELTFRLGINQDKIAETAERKMHSGTTLNLKGPGRATGISHVVHGVSGTLPLALVQGFERDNDILMELCSMGTGILSADWGRNEDCDVTWNTAGTGIVFMDDFESLPACADHGLGGAFADDRCLVATTADHGAGYARFEALVSYRIIE